MSIPISALQRNAAAVIRRIVASGKAEEVTDRGRVVALLSPAEEATGLERLRRQGAVRERDPLAFQQALEMIHSLPPMDLDLEGALKEQRDTDR
ncbi:MAG: prevent-host-death family protein [Actinomycetota bacterium]